MRVCKEKNMNIKISKIKEFISARKAGNKNMRQKENEKMPHVFAASCARVAVPNNDAAVSSTENVPNMPNNPYLIGAAGRREWNDRYMNMAKALRNWQIACAVISLFAFVQILLIAKIATEAKIKPYVVETNQGVPYSIKEVSALSNKDQLLINYAINQFIINAKTIIADTVAEKALLDKLYAYSTGNTLNFLQDFYAKHNPFDLASEYTVSVNIINSLPISKNTWQVIWEETKHRASDGSVINATRWMGHFTYEFGEVNVRQMNNNPFGIYITSVTWSQSQ